MADPAEQQAAPGAPQNDNAPAAEPTDAEISAMFEASIQPSPDGIENGVEEAPPSEDEPANDNDDPPPVAADGAESDAEAPDDGDVEQPEAKVKAAEGEAGDEDEGADAGEDDEQSRIPPWRRKMVERKAAQADGIKSQYEAQMAQMAKLHQAQLAAMEAKLEAIAAKAEAPKQAQDVITIPKTDNPYEAFQAMAKALGKDPTEVYGGVTETMANGGEPTAKELQAIYDKKLEAKFSEFETFKTELQKKEEELAKRQQEVQFETAVSQGVGMVTESIEKHAGALFWHEYVPPTVLNRTIADRTRWAIQNQAAIEQQLGRPLDDHFVAELVDEELSGIYARFKPEADPDSPSRVKDTRQEAPGKPAKAGSRRTRSVTSKDAASSTLSVPKNQAERDALASKLFRQSIEGH